MGAMDPHTVAPILTIAVAIIANLLWRAGRRPENQGPMPGDQPSGKDWS